MSYAEQEAVMPNLLREIEALKIENKALKKYRDAYNKLLSMIDNTDAVSVFGKMIHISSLKQTILNLAPIN